MKTLPDRYKPTVLRGMPRTPIKEVTYTIGQEISLGKYGMHHGPTTDLKEMLEMEGERGWRIIRFNKDGTDEVLYEWNVKKEEWWRNDGD